MRKMKLLGITTCALLGAGLIGAGIVSQNLSASADANNVQLVEMEHGASLRIDGTFGMRFQTTVNKTWLDGLGEDAEVHVLLMLESKLGANELKAGLTGVTDAVLTKRIVNEDSYTYNAVLTEIPEDAYNKSVVARVYVKDGVDGEPIYTENTQTRSVVYVANAALNDKFDSYYESIGQYLIREIDVLDTMSVMVNSQGFIAADVDYFNGASMEVQEQLNAKMDFVYTSSDDSVLLIDAGTGEYVAKSTGTATVTVSALGKEAQCVINVDAKASYKTEQTIDVPTTLSSTRGDENYSYNGGYYVDNVKYEAGSKINLGDGLYVDMKANNPEATTKIATWQFPYAIDFNGISASTPFVNFMTMPDSVLTREYSAMFVILRDTVDSEKFIKIQLEGRASIDDTRVKAGHSKYLNERGQFYYIGNDNGGGFVDSSDINGSMNFQFGYNNDNKEIYAYKNINASNVQKFTRLCNLGSWAEDITNDDPDWYLYKNKNGFQSVELFEGFTDGKAYLEFEFYDVKTADASSGLYIRSILGYDLSDPDSWNAPKVKTSYTTEYKTNAKTEQVDGVKVSLAEGGVFTANNVNLLTNNLSFRVIPKEIGVSDFTALYIHIQDTESSNNITLKLTEYVYTEELNYVGPGNWCGTHYYANGNYVDYRASGLSNFKGTYFTNKTVGDIPITSWFNIWMKNDSTFWCNMDHREGNLIHSNPEISIRNANISIWAEGYTSDAPAVIFFSSLFSQDLTAYK